jgi:hypothetical protein
VVTEKYKLTYKTIYKYFTNSVTKAPGEIEYSPFILKQSWSQKPRKQLVIKYDNFTVFNIYT